MSQRPRLSIDLTIKQQKFLQKLPFGMKQQLVSTLVNMLIEMTERCGMESLGIVMAKAINLEDYFEKDLDREEDNG